MQSLKLSLILFLLTTSLGMAEEVYRTVNERGQVIFTDTPPPDRPAEVIELMPGPSERSVKEAEARHEAVRTKLETITKERENKERIRGSSIKEAEQALRSAKDELTAAREVKDGDWQMTVAGKRHLKPAYYERVKQAEAAVEDAEKTLKAIQSGR